MSEIISVPAPGYGPDDVLVLELHPSGQVEWTLNAKYEGQDSGSLEGEIAQQFWAEALRNLDVLRRRGTT